MKKNGKILFISHDASLTGAPIVLLSLLKHIHQFDLFEFDILLIEGGELETEFRKIAEVTILHKHVPNSFYRKVYKRLIDVEKLEIISYLKKIKHKAYSIVYANTVVSVSTACLIKETLSKTKIILHLHELQYTISGLVEYNEFKRKLEYVDYIISVSQAVKQNIINTYNYNSQKLSVIYPFSCNTDSNYDVNVDIHKEFKLSTDTFIVGAVGELQWRKGYDIFINMAYRYLLRYPNNKIAFIWLGQVYEDQRKQIDYDLHKMGIQDKVHFVGKKRYPHDYYAIFDVLTMVSREDPFPLACLEAAEMAKPIVCFEKAGGITELIASDCGFAVPYLDIDCMVDKLSQLYNDKELKLLLGNNLHKKVQNYFSKDLSIKSILKVISDMNNN